MRWLRGSRASAGLLTVALRGGQLRMAISRQREVEWFRVLPLNPAFLEGGIISQPRAIATAIQSVLTQAGQGTPGRVVAALPGFHSLSAVVDLPVSREVSPADVLAREARRLFSYRPESSVLAWAPTRAPGAGVRRYVVVVARRAALQSLREVVALAGLRLVAVESGPLSLARAANAADGVVVQAESDGCDVVVLKGGMLGLVNSAFWGADIVDQETLSARVIDMVERSIAAHNEANPAGPIAADVPLYVVGAAGEALSPLVAEALGRPRAKLAPPLGLPADAPVGELVANLGMALRGL